MVCNVVCMLSLDVNVCFCHVFIFKQKTAYDMRISDWSSDVGSSVLISAVDDLSDEELAAFNEYSALADDQVQDIPEDVLALDRDMPNLTVKDGSMAFDEINFDDIIGPDPTKEEWEGQRRDLVLSEGEEYGR